MKSRLIVNSLSANPIKWSNTLKQFVDFCRQIAWVCLSILWGLVFKGLTTWCVNQITDFFMNCNTGLKWVNLALVFAEAAFADGSKYLKMDQVKFVEDSL